MKHNLNYILSVLSQEEFRLLVKTAKRRNNLFGKSIKKLIYYPYKLVKMELPDWFYNAELDKIIQRFFKVSPQEIAREPPEKLLSFILWIKDELEAIYRLENQYWSSPPDMDLSNAGISELDQFGELNLIDSLAGGDILRWKKVKKLPYYIVFDKVHKNAVETKIQRNYNKILTDKQRLNK